MWLDNKLLNDGQAYINVTGSLTRQNDPTVNGFTYASPYKQWVFDSCASGATIPSGFWTSSGQFLTRASGLVFDFINGKVATPNNWGPSISGAYSRKEVNVYLSSDKELNYVMEQVYNSNGNLSYPFTGLGGTQLSAPLIMLTNAKGYNEPWALGGQDATKQTLRAFMITNSNYLQEGVQSLLQDMAHTYIPLAPYTAAPITSSGDLKTIPWSYCTGIRDVYGCGQGLYIENVYPYKVPENLNKNVTSYIGAVEIDVIKPRFAH